MLRVPCLERLVCSNMALHRTINFLPVVALLLLRAAFAEAAPVSPAFQLSPVFRNLARASGYIFIGTVTSVRQDPHLLNSIPSLEVTFHVERAFRGVRNGQPLKIHEWARMWDSEQRYQAGERMLVFFYPPGRLGLTSIVGEPLGRIIADSSGRFLLSPEQNSAWFRPSRAATPMNTLEVRIPRRQISNAVLRACREAK